MKTKVEILDDVVLHIKKQGGQAVHKGTGACSYLAEDGKTCGHSMAVKASKRKLVTGLVSAASVINRYGDTVHLKKYQGHNVRFWREIQDFHDSAGYWNEYGAITHRGTLRLQELKEIYSQD